LQRYSAAERKTPADSLPRLLKRRKAEQSLSHKGVEEEREGSFGCELFSSQSKQKGEVLCFPQVGTMRVKGQVIKESTRLRQFGRREGGCGREEAKGFDDAATLHRSFEVHGCGEQCSYLEDEEN